jgi:DNA adenine methylase
MGKLSPDPGRAVYLDPPYMHSTRNGSRYDMDNMSDEEHTELLEAAMQLVGPTVISAYPSDLYDNILGAAGWTPHMKKVNVSSGSGNGSSSRRTEVLWANQHCVPQLPTIEAEGEPEPVLFG